MDSQSEIEDISCNMCLKEFESNLRLKSHMMKKHKEDPVSCEECGLNPTIVTSQCDIK